MPIGLISFMICNPSSEVLMKLYVNIVSTLVCNCANFLFSGLLCFGYSRQKNFEISSHSTIFKSVTFKILFLTKNLKNTVTWKFYCKSNRICNLKGKKTKKKESWSFKGRKFNLKFKIRFNFSPVLFIVYKKSCL